MVGDPSEGTPMRVAMVHSFYTSRQPSGENDVVNQQIAALRRTGMEVLLVAERTDERERDPLNVVRAALTVATGYGQSPLAALRDFAPDVVHVHNLFPNFGRRWVRHWDGPLVAHAHNYRPLCPGGTLYRDGHVCTLCLDRGNAVPSVRHGCYRGSRAATVPLALSTKFAADPLLARADRVIALTDAMRQFYARGGVPSERIDVVENFIPSSEVPDPGPGGDYWLYAGRLTSEKGVLELVREWPPGRRLVVAGSGPLADDVRAAAGPGVEVVGQQTREDLRALMAGALGLVFPSRWIEGLALVALEALGAGTPVLAWHPAPAASLVQELGVGLAGGNDLIATLERAEAAFPSLRPHCRQVFETHFTETAWAGAIRAVYDQARRARSEATDLSGQR
jgi:glycosyltransferase involved in cell wall biosynthesis